MVASGDWMTPQIFGAPQFEKPILYYWMQGASYCAFGESEFAGRFPAALSATVLVLLTYGFARRVFNPRAGLIAGLFMAGGVICLMGRLMLTDIPLAVFVTASLFCYWLAVEEPERRNRWVFWHLFFSGLAVLTKGPIGSLIPLFATLSFTWFGRRPWVLRGRGLWFGLAAYSVIVFPWYGLMLVKHGWKFVDEFFYRDNWLRFIQAEHKSNNHFWYYPAVLLLGSIPWLPAALLAFRRLIGGLRTNPAMLFVACWFLPNLRFLPLYPAGLYDRSVAGFRSLPRIPDVRGKVDGHRCSCISSRSSFRRSVPACGTAFCPSRVGIRGNVDRRLRGTLFSAISALVGCIRPLHRGVRRLHFHLRL